MYNQVFFTSWNEPIMWRIGMRNVSFMVLANSFEGPMTDAWWRCVLEGRGDTARLDEAQILVSQSWGLRFEGGVVVQNAATLRAHRATLHWLEQHKTQQTSFWEEYRMLLHLMRSGHWTVRRLKELGNKGCRCMAQ